MMEEISLIKEKMKEEREKLEGLGYKKCSGIIFFHEGIKIAELDDVMYKFSEEFDDNWKKKESNRIIGKVLSGKFLRDIEKSEVWRMKTRNSNYATYGEFLLNEGINNSCELDLVIGDKKRHLESVHFENGLELFNDKSLILKGFYGKIKDD